MKDFIWHVVHKSAPEKAAIILFILFTAAEICLLMYRAMIR